MIEWVINEESIIRRIGYDCDRKSMYIDFRGSEVDVPYSDVPEEVFRDFISAQSFVRFYLENIKDTYPCHFMSDQIPSMSSSVSESFIYKSIDHKKFISS